MGAAQSTLTAGAQSLLLVAIGYQLKQAGLFTAADAQTSLRLASYLTVPAVILHACTTYSPISSAWLAASAGTVLLAAAVLTGAAWLLHRTRQPRERALLTGSTVGWEASLFGLPFIDALYGSQGVLAAVGAILVSVLAAHGAAYLLYATSGPAFPDKFKHEDGGTYTGEWRGLKKEGFGVYLYPSGATYEGEWRDNLKDGRGVYYFPKGGTYEGEWSRGYMSGIGVRTYSSGKVVAGRWRDNQLEVPLELWQCAAAAEGAADAAVAARKVPVGGGKPLDALQQVVTQPVLWACCIGLVLNQLQVTLPQVTLPPAVAATLAGLAPANTPLLLLAMGMLLQLPAVQPRQVPDIAAVLGSRLAVALFITANVAVASGTSGGPFNATPVMAALLVLLSPIPAAALQTSRMFRLNESLAASLHAVSVCASLLMVVVVPVAAAGLGYTAGGIGDPGPFPAGLLLAAALVAAAAGAVAQKYRTDLKVRMTYQGSSVGSGTSPGQPDTGDAASSSSSSGDSPKGTAPAASLCRPVPGALSVVQRVRGAHGALGDQHYLPALQPRRLQACNVACRLERVGGRGFEKSCRSWQRCYGQLPVRSAMLSCQGL